MATRSSVLAWRIPGMGEPGGLPSVGSHRVGHDWSDLAAAACMAWSCSGSQIVKMCILPCKGGENSFLFYPSRLSGWGVGNSTDVREM